MEYWWAYPLLGMFTGLLAGLLGVGGGLIMVPVLALIFQINAFPPTHLMHLALATSMATITLTSLSSMRSHHRHGSVRWDIARALTPGLICGTFLGALCAQYLRSYWLSLFFVAFVYYTGVRMLSNTPPQPQHQLPGKAGMLGAGAVIGAISSLVAIGGASLAVPFMIRRNVPVHQAIGTSAAIGFPVAASGTVGYIVSGWGYALPPRSFGFVYLPAWLGLATATVLMAPLGVRLAHRMPAKLLSKAFAGLLIAIATVMLFRLF